MKRVETMPGIQWTILTFLAGGGFLLGYGVSQPNLVSFLMGPLFLCLGIVALFGMMEIQKTMRGRR